MCGDLDSSTPLVGVVLGGNGGCPCLGGRGGGGGDVSSLLSTPLGLGGRGGGPCTQSLVLGL